MVPFHQYKEGGINATTMRVKKTEKSCGGSYTYRSHVNVLTIYFCSGLHDVFVTFRDLYWLVDVERMIAILVFLF
jgi:hypothetical protein